MRRCSIISASTASLPLRIQSPREAVRNSVRASCWVSVLPPSSRPAGAHVAHDRAADGDRIDAEMRMKSMILDGDDRVAQVGGDAVQRHVAPMFFEREPRLAVGAVEHRLADAARELVDREPVANDDAGGDERRHRTRDRDREDREVFQRARVAK